jgi:hypothetical protein
VLCGDDPLLAGTLFIKTARQNSNQPAIQQLHKYQQQVTAFHADGSTTGRVQFNHKLYGCPFMLDFNICDWITAPGHWDAAHTASRLTTYKRHLAR